MSRFGVRSAWHDQPKMAELLAARDTGDWFRSTRLGRFYFGRLKKYRIVRVLIPPVWRACRLLYLHVWTLRRAFPRTLMPLSVYATSSETALLVQREIVVTPAPRVFPENRNRRLVAPHTQYEFPEIFVTRVRNALVTGGTNLIVTDSVVVFHDLYDFTRDYTSEELNWRTYVWPRQNRIAWLTSENPQRKIARAACFTDACAGNYAHWLTEVLPRIRLFCTLPSSAGVPLIVNDGLHLNIMESLRAVAGDGHEIVVSPTAFSVQVEHLYVVSVTGYVPFQRRTNRLKDHSHGLFSPRGLLSLRECLQQNMKCSPRGSQRRIFIRRNSGIRNLANAREMEQILTARGFSAIEPERLTFAEQVAVFSNADVIVGATGAAFGNLIFCRPSTQIVILISDYKYMPYWYWQNMACAVGNKVIYVLGKCSGVTPHLHSNFTVNPSDVLDAIG
jgi:capsular polysaccharide biosynthesis protein